MSYQFSKGEVIMETITTDEATTKDEARLVFNDWCTWNARQMTGREFFNKYHISPRLFQKQWWKNGLQKAWIKWHKENKER